MAQNNPPSSIEVNQALQQVLNVWDRIRVNSPIYDFLLSGVNVYHAEEGSFCAKLQVGPKHLNSKGTLHGVFSACVTDWAGGLAIASCGLESTGVSTNININYLSTATMGDWLEIKGYANKVGKSLAFTTITVSKCTSSGDTTLVAQGSHTKYIKTR
ncbi:HotDog domain-containing protein [Aspergillus cavernicola]|uniref:HotDog domain-containing protein n=1 Tax=Aspergillus cavernicola TaxID=176166 RepID=A0ABR4IAC6_9EURO